MNYRDKFDYFEAFSRNIGWISKEEQNVLRSKRIAIAGLGGVGGSYLLSMVRLGIGSFNISDFDCFELGNFNRQVGATLNTLGKPKLDVLSNFAKDINPELDIRKFGDGINESSIPAFLDGVDIYIDGLDIYAMEARCAVFSACSERGIPAITAAPFGMGVALLNFMPDKMTFEEYFQLEDQSSEEQILRFIFGLAPRVTQYAYMTDPDSLDFEKKRGPATPMACEMCAGVAGTQAMKILLGRGKVMAAPHSIEFDAYGNKSVHSWRPWGNRNILQRISLAIARRKIRIKRARALANDSRKGIHNEQDRTDT